jgi:hypothetical protein
MLTRTEVSEKTRRLADRMAREEIGIGSVREKDMQPKDRIAYRSERALAIRYLTEGQTYYTAACFPAF